MSNFNIIKEYLKSMAFTSPHTPSIFFGNEDAQSMLSVNIDTKYAGSSENIYDVTVAVSLSPKTKTKEVFHLDVEYSSIVTLNLSNEANEAEKRRVLMIEVPKTLYPIVRDVISQLTYRSGFPPVLLQYFDFEQNYLSKCSNSTIYNDLDANYSDLDTDICEELSYETVVSKFTDTEEGKNFVHTCLAHGMKPDLNFEETPMHKYLMRFIDVPEYNFPLISEAYVDFSFWGSLYRMLVLDNNIKYRLTVDEVLELYVTCGEIIDKPISKMNLDELDSLTTTLIIDSWVNYNVPLSQLFTDELQSMADEYLECLGIKKMITYDEYLNLFEKFADTFTLDRGQVKSWHKRLEDIDLATIKYRF